MKPIVQKLLLFLIAGFFLYFGVKYTIEIWKDVRQRQKIAASGEVTTATVTSFYERGIRIPRHFVQYKFALKDDENGRLHAIARKHWMETGLFGSREIESRNSILESLVGEYDFVNFNGSDFRDVLPDSIEEGTIIPVTYNPDDPFQNLAGHQRGAPPWRMMRGYWIASCFVLFLDFYGVLFAYATVRSLFVKNAPGSEGDAKQPVRQ